MSDSKRRWCFESFQTSNHGRGLRSTVFVKTGTTVMSCSPFLAVSKCDRFICDQCLCRKNEQILQRCSCCKVVYYCDKKCQKEAWSTHKLECKYIQLLPNQLGTSFRLLLLLLLHRKKAHFLDNLIGHKEVIDGNMHEMIALFINILQKYKIPINSEDVYDIFSKMYCNAFTVCDGELRPIGLALYDTAFLMNHSCQPNSIAVFTNRTLTIRAIKDISYSEEICISYIELLQPLQCRKFELKKHYFFECSCEKCEQESKYGSQMNALRCHNKQCQNIFGLFPNVVDDNCCRCGVLINKNLYERLGHKTEALLLKPNCLKSPEQVLHQMEQVFKELQLSFSPENYNILRLVDKLSDTCIHLGKWDKALEYCEKSLACYKKYYSEYHPCLALQLYRIGKVKVFLGELNCGYRSLCEAKSKLELCYGKDHFMISELGSLLLQASNELRHG